MKHFLFLLFTLFTFHCQFSTLKAQTSPDGRLKVTVTCDDGKPQYTVSYDGKTCVEPSVLGLVTNIGDFTHGMTLSKAEMTKVDTVYQLYNIKRRNNHVVANKMVYTFIKNGNDMMSVTFIVENNNIAFRYSILKSNKDTMCCVVNNEATTFAMPEGTTTFMCPQMEPMTGFARTAPSYETHYAADEPMGKNGWGYGYTFPCLFHERTSNLKPEPTVDGRRGSQTSEPYLWVLVSETGSVGQYPGCKLENKGGGDYQIAFPSEKENNGYGSNGAQISLPGDTPWRTLTISDNLKDIVETTITWNILAATDANNEAIKHPSRESSTIKRGRLSEKGLVRLHSRGAWSWIIANDESCNFETQKEYIDFAAAMGWQSVLVDALWDTQIGRDRIAELAEYGKAKGVGLYLWYNSNGQWNDAPQGPRNCMDTPAAREKEMAWLQKIGIRGIKVDFFGGDKQCTMQLYRDILLDAERHDLLVIFHGCTLPRGWEAIFPNYVASEAVRASENLHFGQDECDHEAMNATFLPFLRNAVGSMDFGGSALNNYYNPKNSSEMWGGHRVTSDVFALATAVLFQSPVQHFALAPNNLIDAPAWAIDFMKTVPTTWQDLRFIDGYPGKYIVLARKSLPLKGTDGAWYISAINGLKEPLKVSIPLDMFAAGTQIRVYSDDKNLKGSVKTITVGKQRALTVTIPVNGACLVCENQVLPLHFARRQKHGGGMGRGRTFKNPVIWADVPDVSVIRVDDNYYMVSTTMHMSPGCTIMKSKDLVNWSVAGYAHDELEETDAFALKNGKSDYSKGSWAANIRYDKYEKLFYLIVTCNTTQKSYIFTTKDIEHGPWHRNEVSLCYDPGFLFEDTGTECKKYVVHPDFSMDSSKAFICEIISDGKGNVTLGEHKKILDYTQADNPRVGLRAEGYHGYKIGEYYYIFMIEGGKGPTWRQQICWRSKSLFNGNWEVRKVFVGNMVNPDGTPFMESGGIAQGGIVQTPEGQWYAMLFQDQGAVGRVPVLISMKWSDDGWPIIGNDGHSANAVMENPNGDVNHKPSTINLQPLIVVSDEFNNGKEADRCIISDKYTNSLGKGGEYDLTTSILKKEWQWNHNPDNRYWSLTDRKGWLRLKGGIMAHNIRDARNTLTQRTFGPQSTAETVLDTRGMKDGDYAGITLFQNQYGYVGVEVVEGQRYIVMRRAAQKGDADGIIIEKLPLSQNKVYIRAHADFTPKDKGWTDLGDFAYSLDGNNWKSIGDTLHMKYDFPDFMGYRFGLFYFPTKQLGGHADFDYFYVKP